MANTAYTDGACRGGNPGETSCAFAVFYGGELPVAQGSRYLGPELHTNNFAEYMGLLDLLEWSFLNNVTGLDIHCDSKLVVEQVNGTWEFTEASKHLLEIRRKAYALLVRGRHVLHHIKGHAGDLGNEYVDKLCNEVLDAEFARRENGNGKAE